MQSVLAEGWWSEATECCCCLRSDVTDRSKVRSVLQSNNSLQPIFQKDTKSSSGVENRSWSGIFHELCLAHGRSLDRTLAHRRLAHLRRTSHPKFMSEVSSPEEVQVSVTQRATNRCIHVQTDQSSKRDASSSSTL